MLENDFTIFDSYFRHKMIQTQEQAYNVEQVKKLGYMLCSHNNIHDASNSLWKLIDTNSSYLRKEQVGLDRLEDVIREMIVLSIVLP